MAFFTIEYDCDKTTLDLDQVVAIQEPSPHCSTGELQDFEIYTQGPHTFAADPEYYTPLMIAWKDNK